jgi:geranylgeranyl transferase type-2 subunit beta
MRLSGVYWGLAALDALDRLDALADQADALAAFVAGCARPGGGYGGAERQDPHLLHTLSAVQVAAIIDRWDILDADAIMECAFVFEWRVGSGLALLFLSP